MTLYNSRCFDTEIELKSSNPSVKLNKYFWQACFYLSVLCLTLFLSQNGFSGDLTDQSAIEAASSEHHDQTYWQRSKGVLSRILWGKKQIKTSAEDAATGQEMVTMMPISQENDSGEDNTTSKRSVKDKSDAFEDTSDDTNVTDENTSTSYTHQKPNTRARTADQKARIQTAIDTLLADPDFLLPFADFGPNQFGNYMKNTVKMVTSILAAIFCPFNSLFISREPLKTKLLAAMGTVPLSIDFNLQLIDGLWAALDYIKKRGIIGAPVEYLTSYIHTLEKKSKYERFRKVVSDVAKPAAGGYCGYWYAYADSLSAQAAGQKVGGKVIGEIARWGNFYYTALSGFMFYVGAVDLLSGQLLRCDKNLRKEHLQDVLRHLDSLALKNDDEGMKDYLAKLQLNSICDLLDLNTENLDVSFIQSKKGEMLVNLISATLEIALTALFPQVNNDTFSSNRALRDLCGLGLTVKGSSVYYDKRIALGLATSNSTCCKEIASVTHEVANSTITSSNSCILPNNTTMPISLPFSADNGTDFTNTKDLITGSALDLNTTPSTDNGTNITTTKVLINSVADLNGTSVASSASLVPPANSTMSSLEAIFDTSGTNFTTSCNLISDPNCHIDLHARTASDFMQAQSNNMLSGLMQGAGLIVKTVLTARAFLYLAADVVHRLKHNGIRKTLTSVPPSIYIWKGIGYGQMSVCMYFYLHNIYLIMPVAHMYNIAQTVTIGKPLFGATPSTFISMSILGVPFMEGGELLSKMNKTLFTGLYNVSANTLKKISNKIQRCCDYEVTTNNSNIGACVIEPFESLDGGRPCDALLADVLTDNKEQ